MEERQSRIIEEGRKLLRVPYHIDGTNPEQGIDCVNFVLLAHANAGYPLPIVDKDMRGIDAINDDRLVQFIKTNGGIQVLSEAEWRPTDIVLMCYGNHPHHTGFLTEQNEFGVWSILHCTAKHAMVVEEEFRSKLLSRLHSVWRSPNV